MEKLQYVRVGDDGELVIQLDGGGAAVKLCAGMRSEVVVQELRSLAEMLSRGVTWREIEKNDKEMKARHDAPNV